MKTVCMIPARINSKRILKKNLRYLGDKPLVAHVIETCKQSNIFNEIYLNSDDVVFNSIADKYGISFYLRDKRFAEPNVTNDLFMEDFLKRIECDYVIQVNPTSPFITKKDLAGFKNKLLNFDTLQSVKFEKIEAIFQGKPLNYDPMKIMPESQDLTPIMLYSSGIMGFRKEIYLENMERYGAATYGGDGSVGYYELKGFSTIDIDYEEDFQLAEVVYSLLKQEYKPRYFSRETIEHDEKDVPKILEKDGVVDNDLFTANQNIVNVDDIIDSKPRGYSWSKRVVNTENNSATLICQYPGEGNRLHYHPDWNEWWYIVEGTWEWEIEGTKSEVQGGDIVFIEKGKKHKITAIGDKSAIRLAVSREDVIHTYPGDTL